MKKYRFLSALLAFVMLLLLSACQTVPTDDDKLLASTPSSSSTVTPPSYSTRPSTSTPVTSTPATSAPTSNPPETNPNLPLVPTNFDRTDGCAFVTYDEPVVELPPYWVPPAECMVDHLYWVVESTKECILICDEPIYSRSYTTTDTHIFFVKESEPTKVFVTAIGDFENHQLFYESAYGKVTYMTFISKLDCLQFVADEKKFVLLDMATKEGTVFMEQYYIEYAYLETVPHQEEIEIMEWVGFYGKPTEDAPQGDYFYYWQTGEIELDTRL